MKELLCAVLGAVGGFIATALGGWDAGLATLILFMGIDYISGLVVAGIFHKSPKTQNGKLESKTCFKGLAKKGMILLYVLIACRLDLLIQVDYIRDAVVIGFCLNELISITENAAVIGIPLPKPIQNAIEVLCKGD